MKFLLCYDVIYPCSTYVQQLVYLPQNFLRDLSEKENTNYLLRFPLKPHLAGMSLNTILLTSI